LEKERIDPKSVKRPFEIFRIISFEISNYFFYQYAGKVYTDYAVYSSVATGSFELDSNDITSLIGNQNPKQENTHVILYPNPNNGEFILSSDTQQMIIR